MHCPECGTDVADDRSSCPACGASLADTSGPGGETNQPGGRAESGQNDQAGGQPGGQPGGQGGGHHGGQNGGHQGGERGGRSGGGQSGGQGDGQPGGQPGGQGAQGGRNAQGGQPSQPTRGPGQSGPGGQGRGQPRQGSAAQQQAGSQQQYQQGSQQGYQQPAGGSGGGLDEVYAEYLADLPIAGGVVAGVLTYVVGFVLTAVVGFVVVEAAGGTAELEIVSEFFYNAHFTTLTDGDPSYSNLPATLGASFVLVPWLLFIAGARFGRWHSYDGIDAFEQVLAGAIVVAGYLPAVAIGTAFLTPGSDMFPPKYASVLIMAGILYPLICGGLGALTTYFFDEFGGLRARTTGFLTGLFVLLLVYGVTFVSIDAEESKAVITGIVSVFTYVAGHLFGVEGEGVWFMLMIVPLVLIAGVGYLRASRSGVDTWLDGVRAGGSIAFGYSIITFVVLIVFGLLVDFPTEFAEALGDALSAGSVGNLGEVTIDPLAGPPNFMEWFVVIGILYPLVVGGGAGAVYVLLKQQVFGDSASTSSN